MPTFKPSDASPREVRADLLVVGVTRNNQLTGASAEVDAALDGALARHLASNRSLGSGSLKLFAGEVGDSTVIPTMGRLETPSVMVVGLGPGGNLAHEQVRKAAGTAAKNARGYKKVSLDISRGVQGGGAAAAEGFELGSYHFSEYLSQKPKRTEEVEIVGATQQELDRAAIFSEATKWARDLVNEPPSNRGPEVVARMARERATRAGLEVEVLDEKGLAETGMNGILTVGRGSDSPPRFAAVTYEPPDAQGFVGLVGKGITFDSGGLSIKSSEGMETMKLDCSGAAAVLAAVTALPALGPKIKVVAAVALAENMPGGRSAKPGDVIRHYGGHTSEVLNTDAEGRLVLADVLAWMSERQPDAMVDLATLTGGVRVALGTKVAGVLSNDRELCRELLDSSERTGERLWELPLVDEYRSDMSSSVADIKNISKSRYASPIIGGLFLKDFVGETRWAHLDIAGPVWVDKDEHYLSAGATGFGARLLIDWIARRAGEE
ncbi:MAG: leucyl aminopeptidase [Actinomycetota bacterium]|nr:leucyl aminopeptidase [Actinomycetota bacterium]